MSRAQSERRQQIEDSLLTVIATTDSLIHKQAIYAKLHQRSFGDKVKAIDYGKKRLEITLQIPNKKYRVSANNALGWYYTNNIERPDEAKPYLDIALADALEIKDSALIARALTFTGFMYQMKSYNKTAMNYYLQSVGYLEELDLKRELSFSYNLIGKVYEYQNNYSKSLKYHEKALRLRRNHVDSLQVAHSLKNIGWTYFKAENFEKSIENFHRCLKISTGYKHRRRMSAAYNGLGSNYLKLKQTDSALFYFDKGLLLSRKINIDFNTVQALTGKGNVLMLQKKNKAAEALANEAITRMNSHRYYEQLKDAYTILYKVAESRGENTEALSYYKQYRTLSDSISTAYSQVQIAEMELLFDAEKKERQLAELFHKNNKNIMELSADKGRKRLLWVSIASLGILLLLVGYFLRKSLQQKKELQKTVQQKNTLLKEVHHRVKNSFQIVSGLLFLQASNAKNKEATHALTEVQNRINAMVLLHQKLYQEDDLNGINTSEYIVSLVSDIVASNSFVQHIDKKIDIESFVLDIETISSIGLIINELVTNSLKHAFPTRPKDAMVAVRLKKHSDYLELEVKDNGIGFTQTLNENSMGLSLIKDLAVKLDATLLIKDLNKEQPKGSIVLLTIKNYNLL